MRTRQFLLVVVALLGCGEAEPEGLSDLPGQVEQPWLSGYGPTRGHEDITRFAVEFANTLIHDELHVPNYFPPVSHGDACFTTANPLLTGNCITDWPDGEMISFYGVSSSDFGAHPDLQDLHYMRNFHDGDQAVSGRYGCFRARERIQTATDRGMEFWAQGDEEGGLRWFGHATHNLQDSFATCHTARTGAKHEILADLCTYKIQVPGVCFHESADLRDRIWETSMECTLDTDRSWDCLVSEAQSAAQATAGYLLVVARHIEAGMGGDLQAELKAYFEGDTAVPHSGYYRCDALTNDGYEPPGWDPNAVPDAGADAADDAEQDATEDVVGDVAADAAQEAADDARVDASGGEETGVPDAGTGGSGGGTEGAAGGTADGGGAGPSAKPYDEPEDTGGCSCRVGASPLGTPMGVAVSLVLGLLLRRRRLRG